MKFIRKLLGIGLIVYSGVVSAAIQVDVFSSTNLVPNLLTADDLISGAIINNGTASSNVDFFDHQGLGLSGHFGNNQSFPGVFTVRFALHASCLLTIPTSGDYTFGTNNDDGVRLRINGMSVITDDSTHSAADFFGTVNLTAGVHSLDLVFFQNGGGESLELFAEAGNGGGPFNANMKLVGDVANGGLACNSPDSDHILINEVQYDPDHTIAGVPSGDVESEAEWFELFNPTASPVDIGGWTMNEGSAPQPTYTFPPATIIGAGEYLLVTNRTDRFQLLFPSVTPDLEMDPTGTGLLELNNGGDELTLRDDLGATIDFVAWEDSVVGWPVEAGNGESICRINALDTDSNADWETCASPIPGGEVGFSVSETSSTITEGNTDTFTVVLDGLPASDVVINITTSDSGAVDTVPSTLSLTFTPADWDQPQTVNLSAIHDADLLDESVVITASIDDASSADAFDALDDQEVAVTVLDDDLAQISIDDVTHVEGDTGTTDYTFTISIDQVSPDDVNVDYITSDATAETADSDYNSVTSTTVTILAGDTSATVVVQSNGDSKVESDETFNVDLSGAVNAAIFDTQGVGTITNDDAAQISIDDVTQNEGNSGNTAYSFTISIDNPSATPITVDYATANGSATTADSDYTAIATTTATISAGSTSTTVVVNAIGDNKVESNESFVVNLTDPVGATIADTQGTGTITNDDAAQISIDDVTQNEGNSGNTAYSFTISIDNPSATDITVDYATANGSATMADSDYTAVASTTATIAAGSTSTTVVVNAIGDNKVESNESFVVNLTNPVGATIADAQGTGTITNDDAAQISIDDVTQNEGNSGNTAYSFTISIDNPSATDITVDYATANGSATMADSDYTAVASTTATIAAGSTSTTVVVNAIGDNKVESNESFVVNLTNPVGATIADAQGTGTITNDDAAQISIDDVTQNEGNSGNTPTALRSV